MLALQVLPVGERRRSGACDVLLDRSAGVFAGEEVGGEDCRHAQAGGEEVKFPGREEGEQGTCDCCAQSRVVQCLCVFGRFFGGRLSLRFLGMRHCGCVSL